MIILKANTSASGVKIDGHLPHRGVADARADRMADAVAELFIPGIAAR